MVDVHARRKMCTLVAAAFVDGNFDMAEKDVICKKGQEMGIPINMIDEIIELGRKGSLAISVPPTRKQKEDLLDDLIDIACADGRLAPAENHLLMKFARQLGLAVNDLGDRVRKRMTSRRPAQRQPEPPREAAVVEEDVVVIEEPAVSKPRISRPEPRPSVRPVPKPVSPTPPPPPVYAGRPDQPVGTIEEIQDLLKPLPPGPIQLDGPGLGEIQSGASLGVVTQQLLRQVLLVHPPNKALEEGIKYLKNSCQIEDREEATKIIQDLLAGDPSIKLGQLHRELSLRK